MMASLSMGAISLVSIALITAGTVGVFTWTWHHRMVDLGAGAMGWMAALIGWDFAYYWSHRAGHRVRILWANHVQHHSSRYFNFSTALRQPVTSVAEWLFFVPLVFLGVSPILVASSGAINLIYQFLLHTEVVGRLGAPVEWVFNTPSHHRVHHGSNPQYLDRNYAGILIVWDRIFGTFEEEVEPVVYGLTKNIDSFNPAVITFHEYSALMRDLRATRGTLDKLLRVVRGPGWRSASEIGDVPSLL